MTRTLLHLGCGSDSLPQWIKGFKETRLDINPDVNPDIVGDMTNLKGIGKFDAVLCVHALEHLHPHDVQVMLSGCVEVLNDGGYAMVFVPDLEDVKPTTEVLFQSPAGPITGLDLIYGFREATKQNPYMKHLTGFNRDTLEQALKDAGFSKVSTRRIGNYDLMGVGVK